ncbi:MAG: hypothetical protein K1X75_11210 [Leptospirales bacterium]|nr:hypothetical protein [Leptospirales bacterium]
MDPANLASRWRQLQIIHVALCVALAGAALLHYYLRSGDAGAAQGLEVAGRFGGPGAVLFALIVAWTLPQLVLRRREAFAGAVDTGANLGQILPQYQSAKIIQWAAVEGAGMLSSALYFLSGEVSSLAAVAIALGALALRRPTVSEFAKMFGIAEQMVERAFQS